MRTLTSLTLALVLGLASSAAMSASLSVSPTRIEVPKGANATTLTIKADEKSASALQIRVFRWKEGTDPRAITETRDVVASPPMTTLRPRQEITVRLVRVSGRPTRGKECYRVLVDRLPDRSPKQDAVQLMLRHSIPMCFGA